MDSSVSHLTLKEIKLKALITGDMCLLGFWIAVFLHLKTPFWLILTLIILFSDSSTHPILKGCFRIIGTYVGMFLVIILLKFVANDKVTMSVTLIAVISVINYFGFKTKYQYTFFYTGLTFFLSLIVANFEPHSSDHFIGWRASELKIGVLLSICGNLIMPYKYTAKEINKDRALHRSLRMSLKAYLSFLLWVAIGWYGVIVGIVSAYLISMDITYDIAVKKLTHRFVGCLVSGGGRLTFFNVFHTISTKYFNLSFHWDHD